MDTSYRTLGQVATYVNGRAFKPTEWENDGFPIIRIQNLNDTNAKFNYSSVSHEAKYLIHHGDLLFAWSASLGAHIWRGQDAWLNQHIFHVIPNADIDKMYLYYFLCHVVADLYAKTHGSGMVHITKAPFMATKIPVPTLDEQRRIVARIEELFSELDNGVETLQKTKQQLAVYRQAVVKSVLDDYCTNAKTVKIGDVCHDIKVGIVIKPTQYYVQSGGVRAFRNANVRRNFIEDTDWAMISQEGHKQNCRSQIHTGDVLIARSGVNLGMAAAVPEQYDGYNAIDVVIAVPNRDIVLPRYLAYYTNSPYGISSVKQNQRGVAQGHLNITVYSKLPLLLPTIEVQNDIIQEIDARLSACDDIEKTVNIALQQAQAMRQSILKQAFEGGL